MLRVLGCITDQHDIRLVILAGIICLFASYSAFNLMTRARVPEKWGRRAWLLAAAAVTGGGVWSTHFVAELAFRPGLPVGYDLGLTALSVVIAVAVSAVGLFLALRPRGAAVGGGVVGVAIVAMHYTGMAAMRLPAVAHWDVDYVAASIVIAVAGSS